MQRIFESHVTCPPLPEYLQARLNCSEMTNPLCIHYKPFLMSSVIGNSLRMAMTKTMHWLGWTSKNRIPRGCGQCASDTVILQTNRVRITSPFGGWCCLAALMEGISPSGTFWSDLFWMTTVCTHVTCKHKTLMSPTDLIQILNFTLLNVTFVAGSSRFVLQHLGQDWVISPFSSGAGSGYVLRVS